MIRFKQVLALVLSWGLLLATSPAGPQAWASVAIHPLLFAMQEAPQAALSASQIDELVSPIALYPDALVAQILAASTYPDQVVAANTWLQANSKLNAADLAKQADGQSWDPSVKALTQFPSVLSNMAQNLSWTSALGDAFYNQQADVMASVQHLRAEAKKAGNLKTTPQQTVTTENQGGQQVIVIQPANPQVVYVPTYNPTVVYGTPYSPPGYSTAALVTTSIISFGAGLAIGAAMSGGYGWGYNNWGCGWHGGSVTYNRNVYVSNSNVYRNNNYNRTTNNYNRNTNINNSNRNTNINNTNRNNTVNNANRNANVNSANRNPNNNAGGANRPNAGNNANAGNRPNAGNNANRPNQTPAADRGYGQKPATGTKSGAYSGYGAGGQARAQSSRGQQSMGGGGGGQKSAPAAKSGGGGGRKR